MKNINRKKRSGRLKIFNESEINIIKSKVNKNLKISSRKLAKEFNVLLNKAVILRTYRNISNDNKLIIYKL
ncbi:hypothetical protein HERIO_2227 [Hepatospora eriocheir]|uniref:HTH psq-type domain-containing protein n=1 Tax=Hepatospora eriocheir TaxID=1081669 RepID=A0A1X0Q7L8_9MICR|nr:hypothetical protein HERIO_2227 [Hepatospora eriocheir]